MLFARLLGLHELVGSAHGLPPVLEEKLHYDSCDAIASLLDIFHSPLALEVDMARAFVTVVGCDWPPDAAVLDGIVHVTIPARTTRAPGIIG